MCFPACAGVDLTQIHSCSVVFAADIDFYPSRGSLIHPRSKRVSVDSEFIETELQISTRVKPSDKIFPVIEPQKKPLAHALCALPDVSVSYAFRSADGVQSVRSPAGQHNLPQQVAD